MNFRIFNLTRILFTWAVAVAALTVTDANAQDTVIYRIEGTVEESIIDLIIDEVGLGETFIAEFVIDTTVQDSDDNPWRGIYRDAIISFTVTFSGGYVSQSDINNELRISVNAEVGRSYIRFGTGAGIGLSVARLNDDSIPTDPEQDLSGGNRFDCLLIEPTGALIFSADLVNAPNGGSPLPVMSISFPVLLGDCNQDDVVDFEDIPAFIETLLTGSYLDEADINEDTAVNFSDIQLFTEILMEN